MRVYYQVKPEYPGFTVWNRAGVIELVEREIFTAHELDKYCIPEKCVTPVKAKRVYWAFGTRRLLE